MAISSIVLIGAGNVGFHLGQAIHGQLGIISQLYSRSISNAALLGDRLNLPYVNRISDIHPNADLYILAIKDDAIESVAKALMEQIQEEALVVHTSGVTPSTVLAPYFKNYGVFYPLQTFSKDKEIDFSTIPICIDANQISHQSDLKALAQTLSPHSYIIDDAQRAILHVAAVFANNFTNHLFRIAEELLAKNDMTLELLKPLILETASKVQSLPPAEAQTGPAIRGDQKSILRHLDLLASDPELQNLYLSLSKRINPDLKL